jgi:hypothetical protein
MSRSGHICKEVFTYLFGDVNVGDITEVHGVQHVLGITININNILLNGRSLQNTRETHRIG